ncbi:hypothetical protein BDV26DRAFT_273679 [Aspergillus bertholletiae]|uniref:Uncharacterized protein n=1 Tax=Aspergillus bertholletiae TaxID=1226010 RepID=A0A5N7ASG6_9EURO|nr:hypothetical protein BDV26DRAFT_273679 [Aspergillus bertholletiae]
MSLGSLNKVMALQCDEEIIHYLKHIEAFWGTLVDFDRVQMAKIDLHTVDTLQLRAPKASKVDETAVEGLILSGEVFPGFSRLERTAIWERLQNCQACEGVIPSLLTFFQDISYLIVCADAVKRLIVLNKKHPTIHSAFIHSFRPGHANEGCLIQTSETNSRRQPGGSGDQREIGYRQVWMYAMRNYPEMAKDVQSLKVKAKPTRAKADEMVVYDMAALARDLGFRSKQIEAILKQSPDRQIAREALLKARKPDRYHYDTEVFESLVDQISRCFSHAAPNQGQPVADLITGRAVKLKDRCGIPPEQTQQLDRPHMFIDQLHAEALLQQNVSSLYVRQSVYYAFFGKVSAPRQPRATTRSSPSEHASDRSSPLFIPDDGAHLRSQSVVSNRLQHSDIAEHLEDQRREQETHRERRRQRREERRYRRRERRRQRERATQCGPMPAPPSRQDSTTTGSNEALIPGVNQVGRLSYYELQVETGLDAPTLEEGVEEASINMMGQELVQCEAEEIAEREQLERNKPIKEGQHESHHDGLTNEMIAGDVEQRSRSHKGTEGPSQLQDGVDHTTNNEERQDEQVARDRAMALDQLQNGPAKLPLTPEYNDTAVESARPVTQLDIIMARWREQGSQLGSEDCLRLTSEDVRAEALETTAADHLERSFRDGASSPMQETEKMPDAPATQATRESQLVTIPEAQELEAPIAPRAQSETPTSAFSQQEQGMSAASQPGAEQFQKEQDDRVAAEQALFDEDGDLTEESEIQSSELAPNSRKRVTLARKAHKRHHEGIIALDGDSRKASTHLESTTYSEGTPPAESYQQKRRRVRETIRFLAYEGRGAWRTVENVNLFDLENAQRIANRYARQHDLSARFYTRSLKKVSAYQCVRAAIDDNTMTILMSLGQDLRVTRSLVASVARMMNVDRTELRNEISM